MWVIYCCYKVMTISKNGVPLIVVPSQNTLHSALRGHWIDAAVVLVMHQYGGI